MNGRSPALRSATVLLVCLAVGSTGSEGWASKTKERARQADLGAMPVASASSLGRPWPGRVITYFNGARRWRRAVDRAARLWNHAQVGIRFRPVVHRAAAEVMVREVPNRVLGRFVGTAQLGYWPGHVAELRIAHRICCRFEVQAVLHEFGHILGLDHRRGICAVMTPGALRACPPKRSRPWLLRCRLLQGDDVRRASGLYGGQGRLGPLYCPVRPAFEGWYRLSQGASRLRIQAGRWTRAVAVRIGQPCGTGPVQVHAGADVQIDLGIDRGCARFWALYPGSNRSKAVDVPFRRQRGGPVPAGQQPFPQPVGGEPVPLPLPLNEDFESPIAGRWVSNGGWDRTGAAAHGGVYSVADSPFGPYLNEVDSTLEASSAIDLHGRSDCSLVWYARFEMEQGFDYFAMEMRRDGGPWLEVGERISGTSSGFFQPFFEGISLFEDSADVRLRLRFKSDSSITGEGVEVDDVYISCNA